jgi:hypothetical protein
VRKLSARWLALDRASARCASGYAPGRPVRAGGVEDLPGDAPGEGELVSGVNCPVCGKPAEEAQGRWRCEPCDVEIETDTDDMGDRHATT